MSAGARDEVKGTGIVRSILNHSTPYRGWCFLCIPHIFVAIGDHPRMLKQCDQSGGTEGGISHEPTSSRNYLMGRSAHGGGARREKDGTEATLIFHDSNIPGPPDQRGISPPHIPAGSCAQTP